MKLCEICEKAWADYLDIRNKARAEYAVIRKEHNGSHVHNGGKEAKP